MLKGYKSNSILDTGYIYAPYIPIQVTSTIIVPRSPLEELVEGVFAEEIEAGDLQPVRESPALFNVNDFTIRKGLRTRHVKIYPNSFSRVNITNL